MSVSSPTISSPSPIIITSPKQTHDHLSEDHKLNSSKKSYKPRTHLSVSQAFKHSCYLCGNLGHHANECDYQVKLCYNCGQPDHRSSECTEPRKNSVKQCFYCKVVGHVQSECPQLKNLEYTHQPNYSYNEQPHRLRRQSSTVWPPQRPANLYYPQQDQGMLYQQIPQPYNYYQPTMPQAQRYSIPSPPQFTPIHITSYSSAAPPPTLTGHPLPVYQNDYFNQSFVTPVNQHYGNKLLRLRSYSSDLNIRRRFNNVSYCYTCGKQGHESKNCPINSTPH